MLTRWGWIAGLMPMLGCPLDSPNPACVGVGCQGEGEGEGEPSIRFVVNGAPLSGAELVYTAETTLRAEVVDDGAVVAGSICTVELPPQPAQAEVVLPVPAPTSLDVTVTARCSNIAAPRELSVRPLAAAGNTTSFDPGLLLVADLVTATPSAVCTVDDDQSVTVERSGPVSVSCAIGDTSIELEVEVLVNVSIASAQLGLTGSALGVSFDQVAATSCSLDCTGPGAETSALTPLLTTNVAVDLAFPTLPADGLWSCVLGCLGAETVPVATVAFVVRQGAISAQADLDALASENVQALIGDIGPINPTAFDLGNPGVFGVVTGGINVQCNGTQTLARLRADALREVGGSVTINDCDDSLFGVGLGALQSVGGSLTVEDNGGLASLSLPSLSTVGGSLSVDSNGSLASLSLPSLSTVAGGITMSNNTSLGLLNFPELISMGSGVGQNFVVTENVALSCSEIVEEFCGMSTRDLTPLVANNLDATCVMTCS